MADYKLYLVTSSDNLPPGVTLGSSVQEAILGGVTIVQLREKNLPTHAFLERAIGLRQICQAPVKLIINDRIDIAMASQADGVHLGQEDMPIAHARKLLGPQAIIGVSVNTVKEAVQAAKDGATYLGVGTCWPTGTKSIPDHKIIGPRGVKSIRDELDRLEYSIPLVVIGGINRDNVIRTLYGCLSERFYTNTCSESAIGIAVVSAIMSSDTPRKSASELKGYIAKFDKWLASTQIHSANQASLFIGDEIADLIKRHIDTKSVRLIHHITNTVVQNDCANLALAFGCSPLMSSNMNEAQELVGAQPGCLVFNLGTFDLNQVEAMKIAGRKANLIGKPIVFDPVGVGASQERRRLANELLNHIQVSVIKGNQAEIATLVNVKSDSIRSCGVDSKGKLDEPGEIVKGLARQEHCIVAMTGEIDWVSDGTRIFQLENGIEKLSYITGSGCMAGTAIACLASLVEQDKDSPCNSGLLKLALPENMNSIALATILGISVINISAELSESWGQDQISGRYGPATLKMHMIDRIYESGGTQKDFWKKLTDGMRIR